MSTNKQNKDLLRTAFDLVDAVVEVYLRTVIQPFLQLHEHFYAGMKRVLRKILDDGNTKISATNWFTANSITYARTLLVIPTLILMARGHALIPAVTVVLVDLLDLLDGIVAQYWADVMKKESSKKAASEESLSLRSESPPASTTDADSFGSSLVLYLLLQRTAEVVTTGSPHALPSWVQMHRSSNYGGFIHDVCDKAFVIPCWIALLHSVAASTYFVMVQYLVLIALILAETASGCIRFQAYFTAGGVAPPAVVGFDFSSSAVGADHIGKVKQTFEMVGTALLVLSLYTRYMGLILLLLAVPLAYESVRRKVVQRVIYVVSDDKKQHLDHQTLKFWMQAAAMGSKLVVGVPSARNTDMVLSARAVSCVAMVIAEAPAKADLMFLEKLQIDFVVMSHRQTKFVTDEVVNAKRVLAIGDDGVARLVDSKLEGKKE